MALAAVQTAMAFDEKPVIHPFFTKPRRNLSPERNPTPVEPPAGQAEESDYEPADNSKESAKGSKKRIRKSERQTGKKKTVLEKKDQVSLTQFTQKSVEKDTEGTREKLGLLHNSGVGELGESFLEQDPNLSRRKRRKTASPPPAGDLPSEVEAPQTTHGLGWHEQLLIGASEEAENRSAEAADLRDTKLHSQPNITEAGSIEVSTTGVNIGFFPKKEHKVEDMAVQSLDNGYSNYGATVTTKTTVAGTEDSGEVNPNLTTPKKKTMKLARNGKLLPSPPEKGPKEVTSPKRRGRPRGAKAKLASTITVIKYGSDAASRSSIGEKIKNILSGQKHQAQKNAPTAPEAPMKPPGPLKPTHPFFLGKPAPQKNEAIPEEPPPQTLKKSAVTPGKLVAEARHIRSPGSAPVFGPISRDSKLLKHPGMVEAPWPWKQICHVRNLGNEPDYQLSEPETHSTVSKARKFKNRVVDVSEEEDILSRGVAELRQLLDSPLEQDNYPAEGDNVRLPDRLLTTGFDIQTLVSREICTELTNFGSEFASHQAKEQKPAHPVLRTVFKDIPSVLTPFDKGECEQQSWTQKYAPRHAADVLQGGKEAMVFRDWLKNLTVMSVESGKEPGKSIKQAEAKRPPKKKRKNSEDDFIVISDEETDNELVELSDSEEFGPPVPGYYKKKSLRCLGSARNKNVVVISGPNGCGKSAAVYAVAKELDFEVFEINSSSRRSGKDVLDRVGDMSENHLVSHRPTGTAADTDAQTKEDIDQEHSESFQRELETGRQGTMTSFFQAGGGPKPKLKYNLKNAKSTQKAVDISKAAPILQKLPVQQRHQKQSLILLEEADILFEEDQHFWVQVIRLASQSKRPIVITCNDESSIPLEAFRLGAVLRLSPPPIDLAADYMILLCAREGHILERNVVLNLYNAKNHDLRASLVELDFWCQMSVGDRKGGLDWIYQRWPPGKDVDEHGRTRRVASQGTYLSGMGWFSHDIAKSSGMPGFDKEEELLTEVWQNWGVNPQIYPAVKDVLLHDGHPPDPEGGEAVGGSRNSQLKGLEQLDQMFGSVSAADIYCRVGLPLSGNEFLDPSLPPMPEKERLNYIEGARVLQINPILDFSEFDTSMLVQTQLSVQRISHPKGYLQNGHPPEMDEQTLIAAILDHKSKARNERPLSRQNFSEAFDILATQKSPTSLKISALYPLSASSFDRTLRIIVEELAPFVRSIVTHELLLEAERMRVSGLLSQGGRIKRSRTTRASRVASEGGRRETKRKEQWFDKDLNKTLVMTTAGKDWAGLGTLSEELDESQTADSQLSIQED
ncbi:hypothetical protein GQ43DRAFT_138250 [Delitschia confertaspora ATCC 74209]|uniref:AAA+ ATPase domain-containing protein n=1 Tax=Delitschia confertaspora ATCC 74209 TaxID=1513339 RepID=A0A9P4JIX3_9PLEO|nr:hypothetical protein GQ43DRAFT_138250 [Delitschia confertaspora ATCC 74209]